MAKEGYPVGLLSFSNNRHWAFTLYNMAASTTTHTIPNSSDIELHAVTSQKKNVSDLKSSRRSSDPENAEAEAEAEAVPPLDATPALESWNLPPENKYRVFAAFWSFMIIGMNDGSYGVSF